MFGNYYTRISRHCGIKITMNFDSFLTCESALPKVLCFAKCKQEHIQLKWYSCYRNDLTPLVMSVCCHKKSSAFQQTEPIFSSRALYRRTFHLKSYVRAHVIAFNMLQMLTVFRADQTAYNYHELQITQCVETCVSIPSKYQRESSV